MGVPSPWLLMRTGKLFQTLASDNMITSQVTFHGKNKLYIAFPRLYTTLQQTYATIPSYNKHLIASYASSGWGIDSFKCPGSPPVIQNFPSRLERCLAFKMQCRWPRTTCKIVTSKPEKLADGLIRSPPGIHAPVRWFLSVTYSGYSG